MEERRYKLWDILIKALGFIATCITIYVSIDHFNKEQRAAADLEFNRSFWQKQNDVYSEVCRSAGAMAANLGDPKIFPAEKQKFLSMYYGVLVLVEDPTVDSMMRELKSYVEVVVPQDPNMANIFKRKVLELSNACKNSSVIFKRANLQ